jgi:hypothetical protein
MRWPDGWPLLVVAAGLIGLAVYAGPNQTVAALSAVVALVLTAVFVLFLARSASTDPTETPAVRRPNAMTPFRASIAAGRSGRSEVVVLLDELDRRFAHPERPMTPSPELARLRGLSRAEFRQYVADRLTEIEGAAA